MARDATSVLVDLLAAADGRLRALVEDALAAGRVGTAAYRRRQHDAIRAVLAELGRQSRPAAGRAVVDAYLAGVAQGQLSDVIGFRFEGVHRRAVEAIAENLTGSIDAAVATVGRRVDDVFRQVGLEETGVGIAAGQTREEVSEAVARRLQRDRLVDALTAKVDVGGRRWSLGTYAGMVARTTTREAVTEGTLNRLGEFGADLVTVTEHSGACSICVPFQGKTYSISGDDSRFPRLESRPPFHPNCRHVLTPAAESFDDLAGEPGADQARVEQLDPDATPAAPAPGRRPVAAGRDMADALRPTGQARAVTNEAAAAVAAVHRIPDGLNAIDVVQRRARGGTVAGMQLLAGRVPLRVEVDRNASTSTIDLVHELGHFMDYGDLNRSTGSTMNSANADLIGELLDALNGSESARRLARMREGAEQLRTLRGERAPSLTHVRYLLRNDELFARAYEQYIATRSGSAKLIEQLNRQRRNLDDGIGYPDYWTDADFEPIARALDALFARLGLR